MTNIKSTKRALLASFMALLLCFSMLLGTTFAWFTDSVSNGVNKIQSGNLDVELYHMNYAEAVAAGSLNGFAIPKDVDGIKVDANTKLFLNEDGKEMLWEPGATSVECFRIKNEGSLALKYQFKLEVVSATETPEGKTLADIINISASETEYGANDIPNGVDGAATLADRKLGDGYMFEAYLLPGEEYNFWVGLQWVSSDVDNEFNVEGGLSIDLGVKLLATQYTYEKDNFYNNGGQYDKDAEYPVIDAKELSDALAEGKDVILAADIALTEAISVTGNVNIDLNGFNLDASEVAGAFTVADSATLTIEGNDEEIKLGKNGIVDVAAGADAVIKINGGNFVSDDAGSTLIKPNGDGEVKIVLNNVNYTSTAASGYALDCSYYKGDDLSVEINGGTFEATTGLLLPEGSSVKGATITANNTKNMQPALYAMGDMTIENCIIKAEKSHAVAVAGGATLTINNCEVYAGSDSGALAFQVFSSGGTININNTTYTGTYGTTGKMNSGRVAIINIDGVEVYRKG